MRIEQRGLPKRFEGRRDVAYVIKGRTLAEMDELAARLLGGIAEGKSLRALLKAPGMPSMPTFFAWLRADRDFAVLYARAREAQAEGYADEITALADEAQGLDAAGVNAMRLRVDARKWIASKLLPRKYGDNINIEHSGALSVAAASAALRTVRPPVFDEEGREVSDAEYIEHEAPSNAPVDSGTELAGVSAQYAARSTLGTELAGVSANGGGERPLAGDSTPPPPGGAPGKGTPITMTGGVTSPGQNPKIPPDFPQSSDELSSLL